MVMYICNCAHVMVLIVFDIVVDSIRWPCMRRHVHGVASAAAVPVGANVLRFVI